MISSFNTRKQVFIAPPSIALKTRELDDATVNNHNPTMPFGIVAYTLMLFSWTTFLETAVYNLLTLIQFHLCSRIRRKVETFCKSPCDYDNNNNLYGIRSCCDFSFCIFRFGLL